MEDKLYERFGKELPAGHVLFRDGDPGREMYVIQSGSVRILKTVRGVEKTLATLGPGEFLGEMSILNNKPRSATAQLEEDSKLLVIDPKTFETMVRGNAEIAIRMIKKLAARLQESDQQIENLLHRDHNSRIVHFLTHAADHGGRSVDGGVAIDVTPKQLASKVGLDLGVVDAVTRKLADAMLLHFENEAIVVHNTTKMREFLEFLEMREKFGHVEM